MQSTLIRNVLFFLIAVLAIWKFISFSKDVKKDLVWFTSSDQTGWVLFSSLEFNEGNSASYISHPGVSTSFVYGMGLRLMKGLGMVELAKSSELDLVDDPLKYFPQLYKRGTHLSVAIVILCAVFMSLVVFVISKGNFALSLYGGLLTLFSSGFLFHSVVVRNELISVYYFILAMLAFVVGYFNQNRSHLISTCGFLGSGFILGLAYFAKSQVIVSTFLFLVFLFFFHFKTTRRVNDYNLMTNVAMIIGHLLSWVYLTIGLGLTLPIFWKLVMGVSVTLSVVSLINLKYDKGKLLDLVNVFNRFSLGFSLAVSYVIVRGLKRHTKSADRILNFTSFWNPGEQSIQAQTIDKDFSNVLTRFEYFLQAYFLESILLITLIYAVVSAFTKKANWKPYLLALFLLIVGCYLNSMRSNLPANLGRSVFKYIIYMDIAAVLLVISTYKDMLARYAKKNLVHAFFWLLLVAFGANSYLKVKDDTNWDWTTYCDIVYPERWLFPGEPPQARKILKTKYKGFVNGHDRIVFGDEMPRIGELEIPGGARHLARVQRLSTEPYLNRLEKLLALDEAGIKEVVDTEKRLLNYKIRLFTEGDDYKTIVAKATDKRKFLYKKMLTLEQYNTYLKLIESGRLSVPF